MSYYELFFFTKQFFLKQFYRVKLFFLLSQKHERDEAENVAYCNSLPHFFLPSMQEVVGEVILPNTFFKVA